MSHASAARIRGMGKDIEEMTFALVIAPEFENKMLSASDFNTSASGKKMNKKLVSSEKENTWR